MTFCATPFLYVHLYHYQTNAILRTIWDEQGGDTIEPSHTAEYRVYYRHDNLVRQQVVYASSVRLLYQIAVVWCYQIHFLIKPAHCIYPLSLPM